MLLPLACCFLLKKLQEEAILLCLFEVVFCSTARFFLLSVEGALC